MFTLNRTTKIILIIFAVLFLLLMVSFFIFRKQTANQTGSATQNQTPSTLPTSATQPSSSTSANQNQTQIQSSTPTPTQKTFPANNFDLKPQAVYSYNDLQSVPDISSSIKAVKGDFKPDDIGVSSPSATAHLKNGDEILILSGCQPHNCGGTEQVIAYDKTTKESYLLVEKYDIAAGYEILGNPSNEIKDLLIFYYKNQ